jgi:hypothetical protein
LSGRPVGPACCVSSSVALDLGFVTLDQLRAEMPRRLAQPDDAAASARTERQESAA